MKLKKLLNDIKGVFVPPKKVYYLGKLRHGTPYFYPYSFHETIVSVRKLKLKSSEDIEEYNKKYPHLKGNVQSIYSNLPRVRRRKELFIKLFNNTYFITYGFPIVFHNTTLGWKDKWGSPRYEWSPAFHMFFFKWQFCIFWNSPDGDSDKYYEQILWYMNYADKDIKKAKDTWPWVKYETKKSSWKDEYLLNS